MRTARALATTYNHSLVTPLSLTTMCRLHEKLGIFTNKVLHLGRRQLQQTLDALNVPLEDIKRAVHYVHSEQCESYLLCLPIRALAGAAGWDNEDWDLERCAHLDADPDDQLVDQLVDAYLPMLKYEERRVQEKFAACVNNVQAKDERLFCARGVARAFRMMARVFFRCAAARERNEGRSGRGCAVLGREIF